MSRPSSRSVVLAVRSDSFSGVERYVCDVAAGLQRRGWRVAVVGGDPQAVRSQLPAAVEHLPATTTGQAARRLAALRPTGLVHAHMSAAETAAVLTRPLTRARVVSTRHFARPRGGNPLVRPLLGAMAGGLSRQIAISRFVADGIGGGADVILNGVAVRDVQRDRDSRQVLVMQRLEPEKDTATAVRAWARSRLAERGWQLQIAGRGSQRLELESMARRLCPDGSVVFSGFSEAPDALRADSAIFLATATAEPFGLAVVEAMACALPVLAADGGAHPETLADAGRYYPPGDVDACAEALLALAGSPADRLRLGEQARARQRAELTLDRHLDQLEALYAEVLA